MVDHAHDSFLTDSDSRPSQMMTNEMHNKMNAQESYYNAQNLNKNGNDENQNFNNKEMGPQAQEEQAQEEHFQYENYNYQNNEAFQFDDSFYEQGDY